MAEDWISINDQHMHGRKNKQSSFYWGKNLHAFANKQRKSFPLFILAGNIRHNGALLSRDFFYTPLKYYSKPLWSHWDSQPRKPRFFGPCHFPVNGEQSDLKNHWLAKRWFIDTVFHGYFYRFVRLSLYIPCIKLRKLLWFIIYNLNSWLKVSTNYYNVD